MEKTCFTRTFVSLASATGMRNGAGFLPCQGLYYQPTSGEVKTALIATHYNVDFSEHYLGEYMASRGYGFLGWNTRFRGNEGFFLLEHALVDIGAGVRWLHEQAGVEKVDAGPKGAVLSFYKNTFANPSALVEFIATQAGTAKLRPDHKLVYRRDWTMPAARLTGAQSLVSLLAEISQTAH